MNRKQEFLDLLKFNILEVKFKKVSTGEIRTMKCTLQESVIKDLNIVPGQLSANDEVVRVYDLDKNDWRSFRIDSIIETKLL